MAAMNNRKQLPRKVLVADDSPEIVKRLLEQLAALDGLEIIGPALNGLEALELFERHEPHGAILDFNMPGLNGLNLCKAIRERNSACLVIILTMTDGVELKKRCLEAGANFFLDKAVEFERVTLIMTEHFGVN